MSNCPKDCDAIVKTMQRYVDGGISANSAAMLPAFHGDRKRPPVHPCRQVFTRDTMVTEELV